MSEDIIQANPANNANIQLANTLSINDDKGRNRVIRAINNADSLAEDLGLGVVFEVVDVLQKPGVRLGRNGMPDVPCTDTYLLCANGKCYLTKSDGIANDVLTILAIYGGAFRGEDGRGLLCVVGEKKTGNGNTIKRLYTVDPDELD